MGLTNSHVTRQLVDMLLKFHAQPFVTCKNTEAIYRSIINFITIDFVRNLTTYKLILNAAKMRQLVYSIKNLQFLMLKNKCCIHVIPSKLHFIFVIVVIMDILAQLIDFGESHSSYVYSMCKC